jgi:parallel beta-helix repeat protein
VKAFCLAGVQEERIMSKTEITTVLLVFLATLITTVGAMGSVTTAAEPLAPVTACGQTLSASGHYILAADLDCSATLNNGVTIAANNVNFHLAGHTILGACTSGDGGIVVSPGLTGVRIDGGTVRGFNDGIILYSSNSRVWGMTVANACTFGLAVSGQNNQIDTSTVTASGIDGIGVGAASGVVVTSNLIYANKRMGVGISNFSDNNFVENNIVRDNGVEEGGGVAIFNGANNVIRNNAVSHNFNGILIESPSNVVQNNTVGTNLDAGIVISQFGAPSVVKRNIALSNAGSDLNDFSAGCDGNIWKSNTFQTDLVNGAPDGGPGNGCIR